MLKAKFFTLQTGVIIGFELSGHSGYEDFGKDIVCATVSSAAYMTVNTITDIMGISADVKIVQDIGYMKTVLSEKDALLCSDILRGFKAHLQLLEELYPQNIKVSYTEV